MESLDDPTEFKLTTVITLKGNIYSQAMSNGEIVKGDEELGDFRGVCTITGTDQYLCTYELYFTTEGEVGAGGMNIRGPVTGSQSHAVVSGTSFDFSMYDTGSVTLQQQAENRWLVGSTALYV